MSKMTYVKNDDIERMQAIAEEHLWSMCHAADISWEDRASNNELVAQQDELLQAMTDWLYQAWLVNHS